MTKEQVIERLKQETKASPLLDATMHVLALRKRPRHNLTLDGLYYKMRQEGFKYSKQEYIAVFRLLQELGLAKVATDFKGVPYQAEDFRIPIPLLGAAACGQAIPLEKVGRLVAAPQPPPPAAMPTPFPPRAEARSPRPYQTPGSRLILTILVNSKPVNIPVPKTLTPDELSALIAELWDLSDGLDKKYGK